MQSIRLKDIYIGKNEKGKLIQAYKLAKLKSTPNCIKNAIKTNKSFLAELDYYAVITTKNNRFIRAFAVSEPAIGQIRHGDYAWPINLGCQNMINDLINF